MEGAIIVSTVTLKHFEPHYQPDSHAARLSHSERAITQPDTQTQLETEWNERADCTTLARHTLMQLEDKLFCFCLFLLNFAVRGGFGAPVLSVPSLGVLKAGDSN